MTRKNFMAIILICSVIFNLSACSKNNEEPVATDTSSSSAVVESFEKPDASPELAIVNGEAVTESELNYYILNTATKEAYTDPNFNGDLENYDWDKKTDNGEILREKILNDALDTIVKEIASVQVAEEFEIGTSESELKENEKAIDNFIEQSGSEVFALTSMSIGIKSIEDYKKIYKRQMIVQKLSEDIIANPLRYIPQNQDFTQFRQDDRATVKHILILSDSKKTDNPKALADEILIKAQNGEDFSKLIKEYNEDPGQTDAGYTFGPGEMVKEFEDAAFALGYDEISDIVETSYGYHIIKRLIGISELQAFWLSNAEIEKNNELLNTFSVKDVITNSLKAQKAIDKKTTNGGEKNE